MRNSCRSIWYPLPALTVLFVRYEASAITPSPDPERGASPHPATRSALRARRNSAAGNWWRPSAAELVEPDQLPRASTIIGPPGPTGTDRDRVVAPRMDDRRRQRSQEHVAGGPRRWLVYGDPRGQQIRERGEMVELGRLEGADVKHRRGRPKARDRERERDWGTTGDPDADRDALALLQRSAQHEAGAAPAAVIAN